MRKALPDNFVLLETEGGLILLEGGSIVLAYPLKAGSLKEAYDSLAVGARQRGITTVRVSKPLAQEELGKHGLETQLLSEEERVELESNKVRLMMSAGFAASEEEAIDMVRQRALRAAELAISEESSREDLHLVQAIQSLDELDRFVNIVTERVFEWYSLHFPELPSILQDNLGLCRLILEKGRREEFEESSLKQRGLSVRKVEAILTARDRSKGGSISERDLSRVKGLCEIAILVSGEREKLAEYVESVMKRIAPNVASIGGSTIGARLIAKAGGMDRLARLPASTIQILGAEKALFRALRTGARPPKHGILFQHEAVHSSPKWQRGKIARTIANKIAIASRVDYYRGEQEIGLRGSLDKRIEEIKTKYKEPREESPLKRKVRDEKPFVHRKKRKKRNRH